MFVFLQIISAIPIIFDVNFPAPLNQLLIFLGFPALDIDIATFVGCIDYSADYYDQIVATSILPLGLILVIGAVYAAAEKLAGEGNGDAATRLRNQCASVSVLLVYVVLPVASRIIFGCFSCEDFDDGSRLLVADYSLSCKTSVHGIMVIFSIIMVVVWPFGVPLVFTLLLLKHREKLSGADGGSAAQAEGGVVPGGAARRKGVGGESWGWARALKLPRKR